MNIAEQIHSAGRQAQRIIRGESVTLHNASDISTEISDAVVTLPPVVVTHDDGPAEHEGTVRLVAAHHVAARAARTITVRDSQWHVLAVSDIYAGTFRIEIARIDRNHPNQFDLKEQQAEWT
jgi:hypothetical protein